MREHFFDIKIKKHISTGFGTDFASRNCIFFQFPVAPRKMKGGPNHFVRVLEILVPILTVCHSFENEIYLHFFLNFCFICALKGSKELLLECELNADRHCFGDGKN